MKEKHFGRICVFPGKKERSTGFMFYKFSLKVFLKVSFRKDTFLKDVNHELKVKNQ